MRCNVSIDLDERGFWHINAYRINDDPGDDGDIPDAVVTTKKGASRDEAITIAKKKFAPVEITVWDDCDECGGTGMIRYDDDECEDTCHDCEYGKTPTSLR